MRRSRLASLAALVLAAACGRCGGTRTGSGIDVEPLPEPPRLAIDPEALPGASGELAVVVARPQGPADGNARPTITFSKPIVAIGSIEEQRRQEVPIAIDPPIPGEWRWLGSATVELAPKGAVPWATRFTVTVAKGVRAVDGSTLAEPYTFTFETPRPEVLTYEPDDGWKWVKPDQTFSVVMNQPVADIAAHLRLTAAGQAWPVEVAKVVRLADERREEGRRPRRRVAVDGATSVDRRVRYEVRPGRPLPPDAEIELRIEGELRAEDGPLALEGGKPWRFRTYGPFRVAREEKCAADGPFCGPWGPIVLATSNPVEPKSLRAALSISPPAAIDWDHVEVEPERVFLPGEYVPGTAYTVTVAKGAKDAFGQALGADAKIEVALADLPPEVDVGSAIALLEASGDGAIPAKTVNLGRLEVKAKALDVPELARLLTATAKPSFEGAAERTVDVTSSAKNRYRRTPIPVRELIGGRAAGLFVVQVEAPELPEKHYRRRTVVLGQITDLAVHAKLGATSGLAWVTRLSDGKPVAGARVALHDKEGRERWTGTSDAQGLARLPGLAAIYPATSDRWRLSGALVSARVGDDVGATLSGWSYGFDPWSFGISADWDGDLPQGLGTAFAERGVYRPGDAAHLKGIVRYRKLGAIATPPADTRVQVSVKSSRGKEIFTKNVALTRFGTWSTEVAIPADAPLGTFTISAEAIVEGNRPLRSGGDFRVEEYRAPQFQVDVVSPSRDAVAGDPVKAEVIARYLFGGAMPDAAVRWTVARDSVEFEPPGNAGFTFGPQSWWWDDDAPSRTSDVFASGEGRTGPLGLLALDAGVSETPGGRTYAYTVEAEVADLSRQRIANRTAVTVHPASVYAGVRRPSTGFAEAGKPDRLEIVAAAPDGARRAGIGVEVSFVRREWRWIRKRGVDGEWFTENEVVEAPAGACKVKTAETPADCAFTPKEPGLYVAQATAKDEKGRVQTTRFPFYAIGSGWVSWQREDTDRLDLVPDRRGYAPGDVARVLVKSPFPEAEALLTVEREGVTKARRVHLAGAATALEVPIGEEDIPNVFVSVVLVRGRVPGAPASDLEVDPGRPQVRIGYAELKVEKKQKRLLVSVTPDRTEARPRDGVRVDLEVKDFRGKGVAAEVTVWAVDEGVLRLTGYQVPDPLDAIHPPRGLSVMVGEPLLHLVERKRYGEKGNSSGGGGGGDGAGSGLRSRFKTTVLFAPEVRTDAQGRAHVEIQLPDNLTTYRIMAVAVGADDRMGSAAAKVAVAKPLMALPALPRLARTGDRFEAGVVVHAPGGKVREVEVRAQAKGLLLDGASSRKVVLSEGKPQEVRFAFHAEAPGEAVLRFDVEGAGERDAVEQRIPVRLPVALEAVAAYGDTRATRREALAPPGGVRPDVGGLEVTLASTALGGFEENARQLVEYPYGCLEQLSSRLVPFIALREIVGAFGIEHRAGVPEPVPAFLRDLGGEAAARIGEASHPDEVVRRTVKAIEALQNADGGYRYWPSSECSAEWASSYAVLALGRAAEVGYPVDRAALGRGQKFLADTVAAARCTRCWGACAPPGDVERIFALYALARTGAPKASYYPELAGRRAKLPLFAKAMLADAMFVGQGDRAGARDVLREVLNQARESAGDVHFEETDPRTYAPLWSSDARTTAIVLATLADVAPDHPFVSKIAAWLGRARQGDGRFRTTQEAAFSLMALAEVVRTKERDAPDFTARVTLGGAPIAEARFTGRSTEVRRKAVPMSELPRSTAPLPLDFARDGRAGVLYYGTLLRYAPAKVPLEPLERGLFVQRWFEPYAGGGQVRAARAGDLVRVRVRIASPQERRWVAIEVPVPAGLEIVDTTLASTAAEREEPEEEGPEEGYDYESEADLPDDSLPPWATRFWSPFNHEERRDDRLVLFADRLPPGTHVASFVVRATTPGEWVLSPAHAEEMYAPETFGRSDGGTFRVVAGEAVTRR
jgi:uncharacterized protein YfaS (alpha-2-macroglobulin family)